MSKETLEKLLGRPLTVQETENLDLYLEISKESVESLLCIDLEDNSTSGEPEAVTRTYDIREGYRTVFTDIFISVSEVKVDGKTTTDYQAAFWDKKNNTFYNSIVLDEARGKELEITAIWGFDELPVDLQRLWAQMFANVSKSYKVGAGNVKSKQVEDFRITYGDITDDQSLINANRLVISKYGMCDIGYVRHGKVCNCGCYRF